MKDNLSPKLQNILGEHLKDLKAFEGDKAQLTEIGIPVFEAMGGAAGITTLGGLNVCIDIVKGFGNGDLKAGVNYIRNNPDKFTKFLSDFRGLDSIEREILLLDMATMLPETNEEKELSYIDIAFPESVIEKIGKDNLAILGSKFSTLTEEDIRILSEIGKERISEIGINNIIAIGPSNISEAAGIFGKISIDQLTKLSALNYQSLTIEEIRQLTPELVNKLLQLPKEDINRIGIQNVLKLGVDNVSYIGFHNIGNGSSQITPKGSITVLANLGKDRIEKIGINIIKELINNNLLTEDMLNKIEAIGIENINVLGGIRSLDEQKINRLFKIGAENINAINIYTIKQIGNDFYKFTDENITILAKLGSNFITAIGIDKIKELGLKELDALDAELRGRLKPADIQALTPDIIKKIAGVNEYNADTLKKCFTILSTINPNDLANIGQDNLGKISDSFLKKLGNDDFNKGAKIMGIIGATVLRNINDTSLLISLTRYEPEKSANLISRLGSDIILSIPKEQLIAIGKGVNTGLTDAEAIYTALTTLDGLGKDLKLIPTQYLKNLTYSNLQGLFGQDLKQTNIETDSIPSKALLMVIKNESGLEIKQIEALIPKKSFKKDEEVANRIDRKKMLSIIATFGASNIIQLGGQDFLKKNFDALIQQEQSISAILISKDFAHPFSNQADVTSNYNNATTNTAKLMYRMNLALRSEIYKIHNDPNIPENAKIAHIYKMYNEKFATHYGQLIVLNSITQPSLENVKSLKEIEKQLYNYEKDYPTTSEQKYTVKNLVSKEMLMEPLAYVPKNYSKFFQELNGESNTKAAKLIAMGRDGTGITESQTALERGLHRLEKITTIVGDLPLNSYIEIGYENIKIIGGGNLKKGLETIKKLGAENIAKLGIAVIQQLGNGNVEKGIEALKNLGGKQLSNILKSPLFMSNTNQYFDVKEFANIYVNLYKDEINSHAKSLSKRLSLCKATKFQKLEDDATSTISSERSTKSKMELYKQEFAADEIKLNIILQKKEKDYTDVDKQYLASLDTKLNLFENNNYQNKKSSPYYAYIFKFGDEQRKAKEEIISEIGRTKYDAIGEEKLFNFIYKNNLEPDGTTLEDRVKIVKAISIETIQNKEYINLSLKLMYAMQQQAIAPTASPPPLQRTNSVSSSGSGRPITAPPAAPGSKRVPVAVTTTPAVAASITESGNSTSDRPSSETDPAQPPRQAPPKRPPLNSVSNGSTPTGTPPPSVSTRLRNIGNVLPTIADAVSTLPLDTSTTESPRPPSPTTTAMITAEVQEELSYILKTLKNVTSASPQKEAENATSSQTQAAQGKPADAPPLQSGSQLVSYDPQPVAFGPTAQSVGTNANLTANQKSPTKQETQQQSPSK